MADTVLQRILANVETTLQGILVASGYSRNVRNATMRLSDFLHSPPDAVFLYALGESKTNLAQSVTQSTAVLTLAVVASDSSDVEAGLMKLVADVEKALLVDQKRNNLAISTDVIATHDYELSEERETEAGALMDIEILYRHVRGNPYTSA